ncbi:MAG: Wzz/FepE/Etk N-terminal domain-containing protein, partial [Cyanobacteria bacterium J06649_11]
MTDTLHEKPATSAHYSFSTRLRLIWARRWLILTVATLITAFASLYIMGKPKVYAAEATVMVYPPAVSTDISKAFVKGETAYLKSR